MEFPFTTRSIPRWFAHKDDQCGAFYNLYQVVGACTNGVPATDTGSVTEEVEMYIARIRCLACQEQTEYISIMQMCCEVDEFLKDFKL